MHTAERGIKATLLDLDYLQIIGIKCLIHVKFETDKTGRIKQEKRGQEDQVKVKKNKLNNPYYVRNADTKII